MNEHIKALFEGQELSTDFQEKATSIVENMLAEKETEIKERVEAEQKEIFESQIDEKIKELEGLSESYIQDEVIPMISKYLTAAVNEWQEENKIAIESGVKVELAESFLKGLVGLAEDHNLTVPDGADSIVEKTQKELDEVKSKLDSQIEKTVELKEALEEQTKSIVIDRVCSELTESQKEKFSTYVESVSFKDESQFENAITELRESYFPKKPDADQIDEGETNTVDTQINESDDYSSSYLKSLIKLSK
ncbi:MAG: hypothetical protein R3230_00730 [Nitrosopumilaceae archaeon]|nr:hypothetical protein [Nitrosopumilaceae archaeon]